MDNVTSLHTQLLWLDALPAVQQRRILAYGLTQQNYEILASLASRKDLDEDVDAALASVDSAVVKAVWLSKPTRPVAVVKQAIAKEKRAKVLAALADNEALPPVVYEAIAEHGTPQVLVKLFANPTPTQELKLAAAVNFATAISGRGPTTQAKNVIRDAVKYDGIGQVLADHITNGSLLEFLSQLIPVTGPSARRIVKDVVVPGFKRYSTRHPLQRFGRDYSGYDNILKTVSSLCSASQDVDVLEACKEALAGELKLRLEPSHASGVQDLHDYLVNDLLSQARKELLASALVDDTAFLDELTQLVFSYKPPRKQYGSDRFDVELARVLLTNPQLSPESALTLASAVPDTSLWSTVAPHNQDYFLAGLLLRQMYGAVTKLLDKAQDRDLVLQLVLDNSQGRLPDWMLAVEDLPSSIVGHFTVKNLFDRYINLTVRPQDARRSELVSDYLNQSLGDDDAAYAILESLLPTYEGTFQELVEVVQTLQGD